MSDGLKVDFAEIDRMVTGLTSLNAYALPLVPKVGALSADGDLLASAILSPGTAAAAEGAVLSASAQLGVTMVSTEALVVITASIVKVYEAAEMALAVTAVALQATWMATEQTLTNLSVIAATLPGDVWRLGGVAQQALNGATVESALGLAVASAQGKSPVDIARAWADGFWDGTADGLQNGLGALGPDYGGLLSRLIWDGQVFGMFNDGEAVFGRPDEISPDALHDRADDAYEESASNTGESSPRDADGRILPKNASTLLMGAAQIDSMGKQDLSDIRVLTMQMPDKSYRFTVQIPSTLSWSPYAGVNPNDLTSDVTALNSGSSTLNRAAFEALQKAMDKVKAPANAPVMVAGFSLGGITAASMAAEPGKYNITQVVTAGAPIANFDIPASTKVASLEAHGDPIATLDGQQNPDRQGWDTVTGSPSHLVGEDAGSVVSPKDRHNADRYSVMAKNNLDSDSSINSFLQGGSMSAKDYYVTRN
jgi:hypothetical protein